MTKWRGMAVVGTLAAALAAGCAKQVVWQDRTVADAAGKTTQPVPTCPHCGQYVDWEADKCANPSCKKKVRWTEPKELK